MQNVSVKETSLFHLAWPIFVQTLLSMCLGYIDVIMIGRFSEIAVGAIGNAQQIIAFFTLTFSIIAGATGIVVSQYLGAKQDDKMNEIYSLSIFFNIALSVVVCAFIVIFSRAMINLIQVPETMKNDAEKYMKIVGCFLFSNAISIVFTQIFDCHGKTIIGMILFFGINVTNIVLNYVVLYGPLSFLSLGVSGVALATSISSVLGMVASFVVFKKVIKAKISIKYLWPFPREMLEKLLKLGLPSTGESISYNIAQIIITAFVNTLGEEFVTAKVYCHTLTLFSLVYSNSVANATAIITGHSVGDDDYDFAFRRVWKSLKSGLVVSILLATLNYLISPISLRLFTNTESVLEIAKKIMFIGIFLEIGRCTNLIVIRSMRAAGDVLFPTLLGIFSMWGISVVFAYVLGISVHWKLTGVWIAMAADEIFRGVVVIIRWKIGSWRGKSVVEKKQ